MKVWIVTIYEPLPFGSSLVRPQRCGMLAKSLLEDGHKVELWTSTFEHILHKHYHRESKLEKYADNFSVQFIDSIGYKSDSSVMRLFHNRRTAKEFRRLANSKTDLPDIIFAPIPSLELAEAAVLWGQKHDIPVVVDIRDLWPDVYYSMFPAWLRELAKFLFITERLRLRRILKRATAITTISRAYMTWAMKNACRAGTSFDRVFPLGFIDNPRTIFDDQRDEMEHFRRRFSIGSTKLVFTYVGSFSDFTDAPIIIEAAKKLAHESRVHFVIAGSGKNSDVMMCEANRLPNVTMTGWLDLKEILTLLSITNVGLVTYSKSALMSMPIFSTRESTFPAI